jgi:hypothetical protein
MLFRHFAQTFVPFCQKYSLLIFLDEYFAPLTSKPENFGAESASYDGFIILDIFFLANRLHNGNIDILFCLSQNTA